MSRLRHCEPANEPQLPTPELDPLLVTVYEGNERALAALAEAELRKAGIPFQVDDEEFLLREVMYAPFLPPWYRIHVPQDRAAEALEIIRRLESGGSGAVACPRCGFENAADLVECLNCGLILKEVEVPEPPVRRAPRRARREPTEFLCRACGTPYRPGDYNLEVSHIYCTACGAELPRQATGLSPPLS